MKRALTILATVCISACSSTNGLLNHGMPARYTVSPMLQNPMMINGVPAEPDDWPASIYAMTETGTCSATLVGPRVLLMAAHCVSNGGKVHFSARANNYQALCSQHVEYSKMGGNVTADWALCLVERPVTGILFESLGVHEKLVIGQEVTLSGYGCLHPGGGGGNDGIFRIGKAYIEGLPTITDFDVVTKGGAALCFGDSGGAAYLVDSDRRVIFGVNSRGDVDTVSYLPFIAAPQFTGWALAWAKASNNVKICGLHSDALYCRNTGFNPPIIPRPRVVPIVVSKVKRRNIKGE